jgi:phosphoribulokinase
MSIKHPIVAVTGSSGAGTTTVMNSFQHIFRREKLKAQIVEGDAFHRHDRDGMHIALKEAEAQRKQFSHFGPDANVLDRLEALFRQYGATGRGRVRKYIHDEAEALEYDVEPGKFTAWTDVEPDTDLLFYEGLHGGFVGHGIDVAQHTDLLVGVVPIINLEWIQKLHRDKTLRGYSQEAVIDTILRRMPDYINYICPQFTQTDINFQRVPTVDTSNPFIARWIPTADESMVVIRFRNPRGIDFAYLRTMLEGSFMSRANSIVIPGGKLDLAMQLILTPMILQLIDRKRRA